MLGRRLLVHLKTHDAPAEDVHYQVQVVPEGPQLGTRFWSTWSCPRCLGDWPRHRGHPRARGVEPQAVTVPQTPTPLLRPAWVGRRVPQEGCMASPPPRRTARAAPVYGLPRPLCTRPPQQRPNFSYSFLCSLHHLGKPGREGQGGERGRKRPLRLPQQRGAPGGVGVSRQDEQGGGGCPGRSGQGEGRRTKRARMDRILDARGSEAQAPAGLCVPGCAGQPRQ